MMPLNNLELNMTDIQNAPIHTAGAYVCIEGLYLFTIGIRPYQGRIPVVRLGGHREGQETGWQCAAREVFEEANLVIKPVSPTMTYLSDGDSGKKEIKIIRWQHKCEPEHTPLLVVSYRREDSYALSLMYLALAEGIPQPSSEVKGLLLLNDDDIHDLCNQPITLEHFLSRGGKAIMDSEFDTSLILEPFIQLRLLSKILSSS